MSRTGKIALIVLIPVVLYGVAKGLLYYQAKSTVDDIVTAASNHADIRYADIATDLRGAVTVSQITVQPRGSADTLGIDTLRISSDGPLFFFESANWKPGQNAPPSRLAFDIRGVKLPLNAEMLRKPVPVMPPQGADANPCSAGLELDPELLQQIGFAELHIDIGGRYHLDEDRQTLDVGMEFDVHDIQSMSLGLTLADVDVQALNAGAPPALNLDTFSVSMRIDPAFGRQLLKTCAIGSDQPVQAWSDHLAERALQQFELQGVSLGGGLRRALRDFYRDWGEFTIEARPSNPIGLLSLMFLPPDQLAPALGLRMRLNDQPIADTSFDWQQPDAQRLAALLSGEVPAEAIEQQPAAASRILVRRQYERVDVADIDAYVDHKVRVKPRGQPMREGVLKGIVRGEAEVEQALHGGKYTVYVPLAQIESLQALMQRQITN
ncbi:MAG: hypothetical protein QNJ91_05360 [Gammaproteobacteria bacterium]|nr:hypothetical protein [Gammaproteobacteria bacterium]